MCAGHKVLAYGCTSHACSPQGTPINPRQVTSWTASVDAGQKLRIVVVNQLRSAINVELDTRGIARVSWTATANGQKTRKPVLDQLVTAINSCRTQDIDKKVAGNNAAAFSWATRNVGAKITSTFLKQLRQNVNTLQKVCVCNCNYCTCNCNYCPCDCNYSCTCNCNYSDARLKNNIEYL